MASAAERKKARDAYLATLAQQRENLDDNSEKNHKNEKNIQQGGEMGENERAAAMSKREKMLEDRRKQFYQKGQEEPGGPQHEQGRGRSGINAPGPVHVTLGSRNSQNEKEISENLHVQNTNGSVQPSFVQHQQTHQSQHTSDRGDADGHKPHPMTGQGIGPEVDDKLTKKMKQAEYAKQLEAQINPMNQPIRRPPESEMQQFGQAPSSEVDDKLAKRAKQAEYARQLEAQMQPHHHHGRNGGGQDYQAQPFGGPSEADDRLAKKAKQAEYARQLEAQMHPLNHGRAQGYEPQSFGGGGIGSEGDDKMAKRAKQAEYARQLEAQMHPQNQIRGNDVSRHVSEFQPFGGPSEADDKASKRAKQAEYARQLEAQLHPQHNSVRGHENVVSNPLAIGLGAVSEVDDKLAKRAKQAEYARQLEAQMQPHHHHGRNGGGQDYQAQPFGGPSEADDRLAKKAKQVEYARQLEAQMHPLNHGRAQGYEPQSFGGGGIGSEGDDKMAKRAKQAEYARQLEAQMHPNQQYQSHQTRRDDIQSQAQVLADGWEMGPLGVPVRKTLAVGNRGVQKAFVQHQLSPQKPFPGNQRDHLSLHAPMHDYDHHHQLLPSNNPIPQLNAPLMGNGEADEREARRLQLQMENARALEAQIRLKKENDERLKREEEEAERKFQEKLEKERREIEEEYKKEQQKMRVEEERKEALKIQIEEKKKKKEEDELQQKELERKEDERIRREQQVIRQREEEEMRREKGYKPQNQTPEPEVHPSPLFRAPSPIMEEKHQISEADDRPIPKPKVNLFSPRRDSPPKLKGRQSLQPPPLPTPVQESPPRSRRQNRRNRDSPEHRAESINIQNHPIIEQLREETALAIKEATEARKELAQLKSIVTEKESRKILAPTPSPRKEPVRKNKVIPQEVEQSLDSKSVKTAFFEDWKEDDLFGEPTTLKAESRFVFPDGTSYQSMDKTGQGFSAPSLTVPHRGPHVPTTPKYKPAHHTNSKPRGDRDDHQRLANDIIKYNSQLIPDSPSRLPGESSFLNSPLSDTIKSRPKSSSDLDEEARRFPPKAHSPLTLGEEIPQRSKSSREFKRHPAPTQLMKSNSTQLTNVSQLTQSETGDHNVRSSKNEASEIGVDFDVDRAFRRNRRKWELLEGMNIEGSGDGFHLNGEEELSLLLGGLNSVSSSRPTTSGESRPPTQQPQKHPGKSFFSSNSSQIRATAIEGKESPPYSTGHNIRRTNSSSLIRSAGLAALGEKKAISSLAEDGLFPAPTQIDYSAYGF